MTIDDLKRQKLFQERYRIFRACGLCTHGCFTSDGDFGTCDAIDEHTDKFIVHKLGRCGVHFKLDKNKLNEIGSFSEFIRE